MEDLTSNHQPPERQDFPVPPPPSWKNSTSLRPDQYNRNKTEAFVPAAIQDRNTLKVEPKFTSDPNASAH